MAAKHTKQTGTQPDWSRRLEYAKAKIRGYPAHDGFRKSCDIPTLSRISHHDIHLTIRDRIQVDGRQVLAFKVACVVDAIAHEPLVSCRLAKRVGNETCNCAERVAGVGWNEVLSEQATRNFELRYCGVRDVPVSIHYHIVLTASRLQKDGVFGFQRYVALPHIDDVEVKLRA